MRLDWQNNKRYGFNAVVSAADLRDFYLPPFQSCARDANAQSVMCAYNAVNGVPSCADPYFLQTVLREHWSWGLNTSTQWVTADCDALRNVFSEYVYAVNPHLSETQCSTVSSHEQLLT